MALSPEEFDKFVQERTEAHWEEHKTPYLLTYISPDLVKHKGTTYTEIIFPFNLKRYLSEKQNLFKIVQHPTQKPKVGLIPVDANFQFDVNEAPSSVKASEEKVSNQRRPIPSKYVVLNFLELISKLDKDEIEEIQLPLPIIAKLLSEK
jgi:hypothetical protein